jgi:hypothetical protein
MDLTKEKAGGQKRHNMKIKPCNFTDVLKINIPKHK